MYPVSTEFTAAIDNNAQQHIRGSLRLVSGEEIALDDSTLTGSPRYDRQCTENPDTFNFGELYVGSAEITVNMPDIRRDELRGGEFSLEFGVTLSSGGIEWIPIGIWDITTPERDASGRMNIKGFDRLNRLKVPTGDDYIGNVTLAAALANITEVTGVEFAQTVEEISGLIGRAPHQIRGSSYAVTCWDEVRMIAQLIGGFAFSNREGKIEFRKFSKTPRLTIPAARRFSARLNEYNYRPRSIAYSDKYGHTYTYSFAVAKDHSSSILNFSGNRYIWDQSSEDFWHEWYEQWVYPIADALGAFEWTPGTVDYYGNPALDLGDMVSIEGGINKDGKTNFLICADLWRFRGPQTLIAAGVSESGASSGGSSGSAGGSVSSVTQISMTKTIRTVELDEFTGGLFGAERTIASGGFSCKSQTNCFVNVGAVLLADDDCTAEFTVYCNDIAQTFQPKVTLSRGEYTTVHFTVPLLADGGSHTIRVGAKGYAYAEDVTAYIWGQEIEAKSPDKTDDADYRYTISGGLTTVTGYIGSSLSPQIPDKLGGGATTIIGAKAFTESAITSVYIPEGVTEIR